MKERINKAFGDIRADDALLAKTAARLQEERGKRVQKQRRFRPRHLAGALAALLVLVVGIFGYRILYAQPAAYVGIDVNPSIELTLNRMDRVISATAYNGDGEAVLRPLSLKGKPYSEAVALLLAEMERQGYISGGALVTMTVQAADGAREQALCHALQQSAGSRVGAGHPQAEVEVFPVTQEVRESAHGCHMSAAKFLAIQELMEVDETATLEAYSDSTIGQIRQRTRECREEHENDGGSSGGGNHGGGQGGNQGQGGQGQGGGQGQSGQGQDDSQDNSQGQGSGHNQGGGHGHGGGHG